MGNAGHSLAARERRGLRPAPLEKIARSRKDCAALGQSPARRWRAASAPHLVWLSYYSPMAADPKDERRLELLHPDVTRGLVARLRLGWLLARFPERPVWAAFMLVNGFVTIGILAGLAMVTRAPFVFPSLGPTAFLFFFSPTSPTASPRHTLFGHAIGIACGYGALWMTGLEHAAPALATGVDLHRVLAAALSLSLTGSLMILFKAAHPPAGATTLIISLGIVTKPTYLLLIEVAVALLTVQAFVINRLAGLDYPLWAKRQPSSAELATRRLHFTDQRP